MFWFLCLLAQPEFERRRTATIFFPYGIGWAGYEYTADLRAQLRPMLIAYAGFAALLLVAYELLLQDHDNDAAGHAIFPELVLLLCFYVLTVFAATRGLPKIDVDLNGSANGLRTARVFPLWVWWTGLACGGVMTLAGVFLAVTAIVRGSDWLAASEPGTFFFIGIPTLLGQLRISLRLQRQAVPA